MTRCSWHDKSVSRHDVRGTIDLGRKSNKTVKEFLTTYKTEVKIALAIVLIIYLPYLIINSGIIKSENTLLLVDTITKYFTPLIIGGLMFVIVYKAIKRNREDR